MTAPEAGVGEETSSRVPALTSHCAWSSVFLDLTSHGAAMKKQAQRKCGEVWCSAYGDLHAIWLNDPRKKMTLMIRCKKLSFYCNRDWGLGKTLHFGTPPETPLNEIKISHYSAFDGSYPARVTRGEPE